MSNFNSHFSNLRWNSTPRYWADNSAFKSHFLNALSVTLPECEKFFIETMKPFRHLDNDIEGLKEFVIQESHHRHIHRSYNKWLNSIGLPATALEMKISRIWGRLNRLPVVWRLAIMTAVEYITVECCKVILSNELLIENMENPPRQIWIFHACEELEHAHVTIDLWNSLGYSEWYRRAAMTVTLPAYFWFVGRNCLVFLAADGRLWEWATWRDFCDLLFSSRYGIVRRSWSRWMEFYQRDFHPDRHPVVLAEKFS